jgi:hypothetical protein
VTGLELLYCSAKLGAVPERHSSGKVGIAILGEIVSPVHTCIFNSSPNEYVISGKALSPAVILKKSINLGLIENRSPDGRQGDVEFLTLMRWKRDIKVWIIRVFHITGLDFWWNVHVVHDVYVGRVRPYIDSGRVAGIEYVYREASAPTDLENRLSFRIFQQGKSGNEGDLPRFSHPCRSEDLNVSANSLGVR